MSERDFELETGRGQGRLRPCPKCRADVDRTSTMCEFCGALLAPGGRRNAFSLEGVVCFYCGDHNRWSMLGERCAGCGRLFAATCPRCGEGVPLRFRHCQKCGVSVEDFGIERNRASSRRLRERRREERVVWIACWWALIAGILLMLVGWFFGRRHTEIRRPAMLAGAFTAATFGAAMGIAALGARRSPE